MEMFMKELKGNSVDFFCISKFVKHFIVLDMVKLRINHNDIVHIPIRIKYAQTLKYEILLEFKISKIEF